MELSRTPDIIHPAADAAGSPYPAADAAGSPEEQVAAWEQIENGRYMPRRVRGSCHGRELG